MKKIITLLLIAITTTILFYTKPLNKINIVKAEINDLTNTQWLFDNQIILNEEDFNYSINFNSNNQTFNEISTYHGEELYYNQTMTFELTEWIDRAYQTITITSGTDTTNANLITWLENNAIQQTIITYIELTTPTITSGIQGVINWDDVYSLHDITFQGGEYQIYYSQTQPTQESDLTLLTTTTLRTYHMEQTGYYLVKAYMEEEETIYYSDYSNPYNYQLIPLTTPIITLNFYTIEWATIQNATSYNIYRNDTLIAQITDTQWTTIENGNYQVQAITNIPGYTNSTLSNTIEQNNYNDIIGNGANFYTLFSAVVDSEIYLIKSLTDYTIWGINFFNLFKLFITTCLIFIIIKFALKQKG